MRQKERRNGDRGRRATDELPDVAHVLLEEPTARVIRMAMRALWTLVTVLTVGGFSIGGWVASVRSTDKAILEAVKQNSEAVAANQNAISAIALELEGNGVHDADQDERLNRQGTDIRELRKRRMQ